LFHHARLKFRTLPHCVLPCRKALSLRTRAHQPRSNYHCRRRLFEVRVAAAGKSASIGAKHYFLEAARRARPARLPIPLERVGDGAHVARLNEGGSMGSRTGASSIDVSVVNGAQPRVKSAHEQARSGSR
jgi:hypothetical protein